MKKHEAKTLSHWTVDEFALILDVGVDVSSIDVTCRLHLMRSTGVAGEFSRPLCVATNTLCRLLLLTTIFADAIATRRRLARLAFVSAS